VNSAGHRLFGDPGNVILMSRWGRGSVAAYVFSAFPAAARAVAPPSQVGKGGQVRSAEKQDGHMFKRWAKRSGWSGRRQLWHFRHQW